MTEEVEWIQEQFRNVLTLSIDNYGDTRESLFKQFDENEDGQISSKEFGQGLGMLGFRLEEHEINSLAKFLDSDHDSIINVQEFYDFIDNKRSVDEIEDTLLAEMSGILRNCIGHMVGCETAEKLWKDYDTNEDGAIGLNEFMAHTRELGFSLKTDEAKNLYEALDTNGDGNISNDEFKNFFVSGEMIKKLSLTEKKEELSG